MPLFITAQAPFSSWILFDVLARFYRVRYARPNTVYCYCLVSVRLSVTCRYIIQKQLNISSCHQFCMPAHTDSTFLTSKILMKIQ